MSIYPKSSNRVIFIHRKFRRILEKKKKFIERRKKSKNNWKKIFFPDKVKLIEEPNKTLEHFNLAYNYYKKNHNVDYDLSNIIHFSPESIAVLAACIASKDFTNNMNSKGNLPNNYKLKEIFMDSGFFNHVDLIGRRTNNSNDNSSKLLHKVTNDKVVTHVAKETSIYVMNKVNAEFYDDMEPLYDILIEAMQNTNNHASANTKKEYDWWLYSYDDEKNNLLHFTFLDIGVGVFKSLPVKNFITKLTNKINVTSNLDLVNDLLNGKIKSRTGRKDRGKGIPQIYELSKDVLFENFYILTNDILINTKNEEKTRLSEEFHGTLYYWTIKY